MSAVMAIGLGLLAVGLVFVLTGRRATEEITTRTAIVAVVQALVYVAVAIALAAFLASLDASFVRIVVAASVIAGIGWSVIRAARSPSPSKRIVVLGATLALSVILAAVLGMLTGGDEPVAAAAASTSSTEDAAGDCECDAASDLKTLGLSPDGTVLVTVDASIPESATFWLWSVDDPFTPIAITRTDGTWSIQSGALAGVDPVGILLIDSPAAVGLQLGYDVGAVAVTSAQGDRIPDTGYFGGDGMVPSTEIEDSFQRAYGDLGVGHRVLASAFINSQRHMGTFSYDVGVSADPEVKHTGALIVATESVEFHVDASDTRVAHTDRLGADGSVECFDEGTGSCVGMWPDQFTALDQLLSAPGSIEILVVEGRGVLGEEAVCVAVVDPGSSALHEGEFCSFSDGTIAFADDRTAGIVLVLVDR